MLQGTKVYSILHNRCPRCHKGHFFKTDNALSWKYYDKMNAKCSVCGESFEREPGFYFGGMYGSYLLYSALIAASIILFIVLLKLNIYYVLGVLVPVILLSQPLFFRWGRLVWINIFVKYDPEIANGSKKATPKW
jgi:uncharacterized protein (DUF983 family)